MARWTRDDWEPDFLTKSPLFDPLQPLAEAMPFSQGDGLLYASFALSSMSEPEKTCSQFHLVVDLVFGREASAVIGNLAPPTLERKPVGHEGAEIEQLNEVSHPNLSR